MIDFDADLKFACIDSINLLMQFILSLNKYFELYHLYLNLIVVEHESI